MPVWGFILAGLFTVSVFGAVIVLDRRMIRRRALACGGKDVDIVGPFPSWGYEARMNHRRYGVMYTDSRGRAREVTVFVSFGYMRIDGQESF